MTDPDWEPIMKIAAGIVNRPGGKDLPCRHYQPGARYPVCGGDRKRKHGPRRLPERDVCCAGGRDRIGLRGTLDFRDKALRTCSTWKKPQTKIMMECRGPGQCLSPLVHPSDGVGLARRSSSSTLDPDSSDGPGHFDRFVG